jgi:membrane protein implicated in regulation of membrane protease activity
MRRRFADLYSLLALLGLAALFWGGIYYSVFGTIVAVLNLLFILAMIVATFLARRNRPGQPDDAQLTEPWPRKRGL